MKLKDKLWNWGHLAGSHNPIMKFDCKMDLTTFAKEYQVSNAFVISYAGNIQPPYDNLAEELKSLREIKWSVLGDASTPLPESPLGWTDDVIEIANKKQNITGGMVDDFFSPERLEKYPPEILKQMHEKLNNSQKNLDFWSVLYVSQLEEDVKKHIECFDGVSFWAWVQEDIDKIEEYVDKFFKLAEGKRKMLGIYLYDYGNEKPMAVDKFKRQLEYYVELLKQGKIEGIIFCSGCIGDMDLEANKFFKAYMQEHADDEI